jgi:hypothetical protein
MKVFLSVIIVTLFANFNIAIANTDQLTAQKKKDIIALMYLSGADGMALQMAQMMNNAMIPLIKKANEDVPEKAINVLEEESMNVMRAEMNSMMEIMVPIYSKYYTHDDILELIKFYQTDLGKKTVKVTPSLMSESIAAGQIWGRDIFAAKLVERLKTRFLTEGIDFPE